MDKELTIIAFYCMAFLPSLVLMLWVIRNSLRKHFKILKSDEYGINSNSDLKLIRKEINKLRLILSLCLILIGVLLIIKLYTNGQ